MLKAFRASSALPAFGSNANEEKTVVKFHWLLPSFLSVFLLAGTAEAARLQSWRFDASENRALHYNRRGSTTQGSTDFQPDAVGD